MFGDKLKKLINKNKEEGQETSDNKKIENLVFFIVILIITIVIINIIWNGNKQTNKQDANTTSKKLARFCVALASLLVNVDETYENIIVTKEIVDYMVKYLTSIYDNSVFKLKDYADEYRAYSNCTDDDIKDLQDLYARNATLFNFLNGQSRTSRTNLLSVSGLDNSKFFAIFNKLVARKFIRLNLDNVYPTDKFRKAFNIIDKSFTTDTGSMIDISRKDESNDSGVVFINDLEGDK